MEMKSPRKDTRPCPGSPARSGPSILGDPAVHLGPPRGLLQAFFWRLELTHAH